MPDALPYAKRNNNVKGYVGRDGRFYLRNRAFWETMPDDLSIVSKPVEIDGVLFGIYPPAASARRSMLARQFVGYLGALVGPEKVHELRPWPDPAAVNPAMCRMPATIPLAEIIEAVSALGGHYPGGEVGRFHAGLNYLDRKHFVILSGLSGSGKTMLALAYARAVHGVPDMHAPDPFLAVCPVRPEWTDPTGLTGYYDVLSKPVHRASVPGGGDNGDGARGLAGVRRAGRDEFGPGRVLLVGCALLYRDERTIAVAFEQRAGWRGRPALVSRLSCRSRRISI